MGSPLYVVLVILVCRPALNKKGVVEAARPPPPNKILFRRWLHLSPHSKIRGDALGAFAYSLCFDPRLRALSTQTVYQPES